MYCIQKVAKIRNLMVFQSTYLVFGTFINTASVKSKKLDVMCAIMHCGGKKGQLHEMVLFYFFFLANAGFIHMRNTQNLCKGAYIYNEKQGGSATWRLLSSGLGPW